METLGNDALLKLRKVGYFAAGKIASLSVLPTLDWATEVAKRRDVAVVSGFYSKLEREVLDILLRGECGIICVLTRPLYVKIPERYREAFAQGRVLFVVHRRYSTAMPSRQVCRQRNEFVAAIADELVFSSLTPESSLHAICAAAEALKLIRLL